MIRFPCPTCGITLKAPDGSSGRHGRCSCGSVFSIPRDLGSESAPLDLDEDDYEPYRPRRRTAKAWSGWVVVAMLLLTIMIPLVGIILGTIDMVNEGPRRIQGAAFLACGLVMTIAYAIGYLQLG
jgi:hypothetical protein